MEAARLLEDIKEYQSDISRSQGARRAEMSEKSFEAYAALAVYLEDLSSGKLENKAGSEKIETNLKNIRQRTIEFAQAYAASTKSTSAKSRALYHIYINQYLLGQTQSIAKLVKIKSSLPANLSNRVEFLLALADLDSGNAKTRSNAQNTMKAVSGKLPVEGAIAAQLSLAKSFAGLSSRGAKIRKPDAKYRAHLVAASNKSATLADRSKELVFNSAMTTWRAAEGRNATWSKAPVNLSRFENSVAVKALIERTALEDYANNRQVSAIRKYDSLSKSFDGDVRSLDLDSRSLEMNRNVWMTENRGGNSLAAALAYEKAVLKQKNKYDDKSTLGQVPAERAQQMSSEIIRKHKELVTVMLDRSAQKATASNFRVTSIRMADDYSATIADQAEIELIKSKTGSIYALNSQHSDAVRVYLALAEKSASGNSSKYLLLASQSQKTLARWPDVAPWNGVSAGDAGEREHLVAIYKRLNEANKNKNEWPLVSHIGLLEVNLGRTDAAFSLWQSSLEKSPSGPHAANAAGFMLSSYKGSKNWQSVESLARLCNSKKLTPVYKNSRIDTNSLLALALLEGGKELLAAGNFDQAVTKLYDFTKNFGGAANHDEGFFLLASAYHGAKKHPESIQTLQAFSERFETSKYFKTALIHGGDWSIPLAFEDHAMYFYSKFLKRFGSDSQSMRISEVVIDIAMGKALYARAIESLKWQTNNTALAATKRSEAAREIIRIEERQGDAGRAFTTASGFSTASWADDALKAESLAVASRFHAGKQNFAKLKATEKAIMALGGGTPEAQEALGEVRFLLADSQGKVMAEEVFNLELKNPYQTINEQYRIFNEAKSQYTRVCDAGSTSWCAPAMARISALSGGLIKAVEEVDIPETLAKEEVDRFHSRKNSMMDEMSKVAVSSDARAIALVSEGKTNPDWTQKILWNNSSDWNFERVSGETGNAYIQYSAAKAE